MECGLEIVCPQGWGQTPGSLELQVFNQSSGEEHLHPCRRRSMFRPRASRSIPHCDQRWEGVSGSVVACSDKSSRGRERHLDSLMSHQPLTARHIQFLFHLDKPSEYLACKKSQRTSSSLWLGERALPRSLVSHVVLKVSAEVAVFYHLLWIQ